MVTDKPNHNNEAYIDTNVRQFKGRETWIRTFSKEIKESLLEWHTDGNRAIDVIDCNPNEWFVEFEGEPPIPLEVGMEIISSEGVYHRPIKNNPTKDLVIEITEYFG